MINLLRFVVLIFAACFVLFLLGFTVFEGFHQAYLWTSLKTAAVVAAFAFAYKFFALKRDQVNKRGKSEGKDH